MLSKKLNNIYYVKEFWLLLNLGIELILYKNGNKQNFEMNLIIVKNLKESNLFFCLEIGVLNMNTFTRIEKNNSLMNLIESF